MNKQDEPYKLTNNKILQLKSNALNNINANNIKYMSNHYNFNDFLLMQKMTTNSTKATSSSNSLKYDNNYRTVKNDHKNS
jgi:hypothetical protein